MRAGGRDVRRLSRVNPERLPAAGAVSAGETPRPGENWPPAAFQTRKKDECARKKGLSPQPRVRQIPAWNDFHLLTLRLRDANLHISRFTLVPR